MTYSPGALGQFALGQGSEGAAGAYTLSGATGAFTLAGYDTTFTTTGALSSGATGVFVLTGNAATAHLSHTQLQTTVGGFTLVGHAALLVLPSPMTVTDGFTLVSAASAAWRAALNDFLGVGGAAAHRYVAGGVVDDTVSLNQLLALTVNYHLTMTDALRFYNFVKLVLPAAVLETVTMSANVRAIAAILVAERLAVRDVYMVMAKYNLSVNETVRILANIFHHIGGSITDGMTLGGTVAHKYYTYGDIVEHAVLADLFGHRLLVSVTCADTLEFNDSDILKMIFRCDVTDEVEIDIAYVAPSGSYTTWAINTRNNHVTEYQNFTFNSFAKIGNKYIAAAKDGVYELLGDDDNGVPIPTITGTGFFQPGGGHYTAFKAAYLGMAIKTGVPSVFLKLITGDMSEYVYAVNPLDRATARVQFGKGLRSRYFAFELITAGADFDLDSIEFIPLISKRRYS